MNGWLSTVIEILAAGLVGLVCGYLLKLYLGEAKVQSAKAQADTLLAGAQTKYKEMLLAAKDEAHRIRDEAQAENNKRRASLQRQEGRLQKRREDLDRKLERVEARERKLDQRQSRLDRLENELNKLHEERTRELERISTLTREEAKGLLLETVEEESRQDMARVIREVETQAKEEADRKAREIITLAIQRCASEQVAETTVSMVPLPSDDMKGRIIGRGGRNIRALETATGVDLVVDDTPEAVILSSFDPVRREVARIALSRLILDGRIHPARVEKMVKKAQEEVEATIREEGERMAYEVDVHGLHPELIKLLGRLKYRTSYGQNMQAHSLETARLAGIMAAELGADVALAKESGLLHDIGKAVDHQIDGPHALIGADIAKSLGKSEQIVNCIAAHHGEQEPQCLEAILVEAADAVSGARPGARRESLESYIKRIGALEDLANSFAGVAQSYAIQAGREIRIIVRPEEVDDLTSIQLAKDVAKQVEESLEYPGQIKVTVIRETRAVDYAK
jgi:ribonuclease Y